MNIVSGSRDDQLENEAREWLVRLNSGRAREDDIRAAAAWRAQSPRHDSAYRDIEHTWTQLARLGPTAAKANARITSRSPPAVHSGSRRSYWKALAAALLFFAIGCTWLAMLPGGMRVMLADARTAVAQQRTLTLDDGTRVTLNGASALDWHLTPNKRQIRLIAGDAYFEVTRDASRPFIVTTADARIRVTGTAFAIQQRPGTTQLTVTEGRVMAAPAGQGAEVLVTKGQALHITRAGTSSAYETNADEGTSWLRGRLIFRDTTLPDIAAALARYTNRNIFVIGSRARTVRLTGVFDSNDSDRILEIISRTEGLQAYEVGPLFTVIR